MKATGTVSQPKNSDFELFEAGTYNTRLVEMFLVAGTKYQSDEPQIEAVMRWEIDPEAAPVRESFLKINYVSVTSPKFDKDNPAQFEFQTERKYANKFQQRLEALLGQMLTAEDASRVEADITTPDFITDFDELLDHLQNVDNQGNSYRAPVTSFKIGGQELIGAEALITLSITEKQRNGQTVEYQKVESVTAIPRGRGARRAAPAPAPQPSAGGLQVDEPPVQERLMDPPPARRHASTEPDLPF